MKEVERSVFSRRRAKRLSTISTRIRDEEEAGRRSQNERRGVHVGGCLPKQKCRACECCNSALTSSPLFPSTFPPSPNFVFRFDPPIHYGALSLRARLLPRPARRAGGVPHPLQRRHAPHPFGSLPRLLHRRTASPSTLEWRHGPLAARRLARHVQPVRQPPSRPNAVLLNRLIQLQFGRQVSLWRQEEGQQAARPRT